jgi:hypothetical protein
MRQIINLISIVLVSMLMSCAIETREGDQIVPAHLYDLSISYSHQEKAFLFGLTSYADDEICIPRMSWVDERGGHFFFEDRQIYFVDRGIRYEIKDLASGYCTPQKDQGCVHVLKKNDQLFGKLPIEDFVVPPEIYLEKDFNPQFRYPHGLHYCEN